MPRILSPLWGCCRPCGPLMQAFGAPIAGHACRHWQARVVPRPCYHVACRRRLRGFCQGPLPWYMPLGDRSSVVLQPRVVDSSTTPRNCTAGMHTQYPIPATNIGAPAKLPSERLSGCVPPCTRPGWPAGSPLNVPSGYLPNV